MPIFEYKCNVCGHVFEELVMGTRKTRIACPKCKKTDVGKLISRTGAVGKGSTAASGCASPSGSGFS